MSWTIPGTSVQTHGGGVLLPSEWPDDPLEWTDVMLEVVGLTAFWDTVEIMIYPRSVCEEMCALRKRFTEIGDFELNVSHRWQSDHEETALEWMPEGPPMVAIRTGWPEHVTDTRIHALESADRAGAAFGIVRSFEGVMSRYGCSPMLTQRGLREVDV